VATPARKTKQQQQEEVGTVREKLVQLSVRLVESKVVALKVRSARSRTSLRSIIEQLVDKFLAS
jgi:hypothetical protein